MTSDQPPPTPPTAGASRLAFNEDWAATILGLGPARPGPAGCHPRRAGALMTADADPHGHRARPADATGADEPPTEKVVERDTSSTTADPVEPTGGRATGRSGPGRRSACCRGAGPRRAHPLPGAERPGLRPRAPRSRTSARRSSIPVYAILLGLLGNVVLTAAGLRDRLAGGVPHRVLHQDRPGAAGRVDQPQGDRHGRRARRSSRRSC